jgi:hypothetical protein
LKVQRDIYQRRKKKLDKKWSDLYLAQKIRQELIKTKIDIIKYNYAMDKEVQNFDCQDGFLEISENGQDVQIFNLKIVENNQWVLEADPNQVKALRDDNERIYAESQNKKLSNPNTPVIRSRKDTLIEKIMESENSYCEYEYSKPKMNKVKVEYELDKSSASHHISQIESIMFGGLSSRFWSLRKHINYMSTESQNMKSMPFFAWECITLKLSHRDVDIVIKNQKS